MALIHYIETFSTWTPSTQGVWEEKDLSAFIPVVGDITAEIIIGTSGDVDITYSGGVRTPGSSLDRLALLNYAKDSGGYNTASMHVRASGGKIESYGPSGVGFFLVGYWVGAQFVELSESFLGSGANSWTNGNLSSFGVPSGAIADIAASQSFGAQTQGFRSVGSSTERRFVMDDGDHNATPDNYSFWSSPIQTSGVGATIQHYVAFATDWQPFQVLGYWEIPPGDFTDLYDDDAANPPSELTWDDVAVTGLPSDTVGAFLFGHQDNLNSRVIGIRESGSSLERKINGRKRTSSSARSMISAHVNSLGGNIETIAENVIASSDHFVLVGYWDNFGQIAPTPVNDNSTLFALGHAEHNTSGVFPSGMPMVIVGIEWASANLYVQSIEPLSASVNLFLQAPIPTPSGGSLFIRGPHLVGTSGVGQSNSGINPILEVSGNSPSLFSVGPILSTRSGNLYVQAPETLSSSADLFLKVFDNKLAAHYIEDFQIWTPSTKDTWETKDLSLLIPDVPKITLEIMIGVSGSVDIGYSCGVRTPGSTLDRRVNLNYARDSGGYNSVTMHVQVSGGKIEHNAPSGVNFFMMGYWIGTEYVELIDSFIASGTNSWTNGNLDSFGVPSGAIAEVTCGQSFGSQTQGVRSVGSSTERRFVMDKGDNAATPDNYTFWSSFLQTSGATATIQHYAAFSIDWQEFNVFGYWSTPPGDYTDLYVDDSANPPNEFTWDEVNIPEVPTGSVASFLVGHRDNLNSRIVGIRQSGSTLERKINVRKRISDRCMMSWHTNSLDGTVESIAENVIATNDHLPLVGYWDNFTISALPSSDSHSLYIAGELGVQFYSETTSLFTNGLDSINSSGQYPSGVLLFMHGAEISDFDLNIRGKDNLSSSSDMFVFGANIFRTDLEFSLNYPSGLSLFVSGSGIISESGQTTLYTAGLESLNASVDVFVEGLDFTQTSGDLFIKTSEPFSDQITLYLHNPSSSGTGLLGGANAIFYLSRRDHDDNNITKELVENIDWPIPTIMFGNKTFLDQSGAITTVGDGTLPKYNDMGGGFSSSQFGSALIGSTPQQQNIVGNVLSPEDYPYVGSGSITTAFWMSGAKTSGNKVDTGWFFREGTPPALGKADNTHTVGIKINSISGIQVRTSVRDLPYDLPTSVGLWWGGTTHYGTPTGSSWTWRTPDEYWAWDEEWPEINISHNDVAFFMVRSEFIASGIISGIPSHMNVFLSVDGKPWTFVGSGITGPPASSLFSLNNPRNRHAEDSIGIRLQAVNADFLDESIIVNEIVLWSDANMFSTDELNLFHSIVPNHFKPLDEYNPTLVTANPTYILRTIGSFTLPAIVQGEGLNTGNTGKGAIVTLEVGLGDYGEDASAYLLEEKPPSGFIIRNIRPGSGVRYLLQGNRPEAQQQIFHDPQSGIMQPYNDVLGFNEHAASIRWVNHDNHPQQNERRIPVPTGIYSYELYPFTPDGATVIEAFDFSGSGLFFNGTNSSGTFAVETTGDTSGTTSGMSQGINSSYVNLFMSAPEVSIGTVNLYIRTEEKFTSAFIGNAARTPEATDFIFAADGEANTESLAGFEYGPTLYSKGPLSSNDNVTLVLFGPEADEITLFIEAFQSISGDLPSGVLLKVGDGHEVSSGSINLFTSGPIPFSGTLSFYIQAGGVGRTTLFAHGFKSKADAFDSYIQGPEFITTSGDFVYPLDDTLFAFPSGGNSPDLYVKGPEFIITGGNFAYPGDSTLFTTPSGGLSPDLFEKGSELISDSITLFIGPIPARKQWTLYLKTESNIINDNVNLFTHGTNLASGVSQVFNNSAMYLEAKDADFPYTAGGTDNWTMFLKGSGNDNTPTATWSLFLKADTTTTGVSPLFTFAHGIGESPRGIEITGSVGMLCSTNPDDISRIGFIPHNSHDDPWTLFVKGEPGFFNTATLYMSGSSPVNLTASGNLFVKGLFGQHTGISTLYLLGVSGLFNNGPSGLHLFIDASTLVYNTSGNMYTHGY